MNSIRKDFPFFNKANTVQQEGDGLPRRYAPRNDGGAGTLSTRHCERSAAIHLTQGQGTNNIVFFDSAASAQKPGRVIGKLNEIYSYHYANIHRGIYDLSARLTEEFERVRSEVASFINARSENEIVFSKNATEAINLVAHSYGRSFVNEGDEVLVSMMEHHSNIVPWQQLCKERGAVLKAIPITNDGELILSDLEALLSNRTKIIAITHMSNVLGSTVDIKAIASLAQRVGAKLLVDACQSVVHMKLDVQALGCDFLAFSSHKLYGPSGVGILYGKQELFEIMGPYQTGGSMVKEVSFDSTSFLEAPHKFEAGTPAIAEVIAFGEVLRYLKEIDLDSVWEEEKKLARHIRNGIRSLGNYTILGKDDESSIISILHSKAHHSDIGEILNQCGVAIRTGHHCAQPLMNYLGIAGTARISLGIYNDLDDAESLILALEKCNKLFG